MADFELERRRVWAQKLLDMLSLENEMLASQEQDHQTGEDAAFVALQQEADEKLAARKARLTETITALKTGLSNMTAITTAFHAFREDPEAQKRWSYPFQLLRKGRETNRNLTLERERMNGLVLQQRLLEEEIRRLSDSVTRDALVRLKQSGPQTVWMELLARRQQTIDNLCLLLPSIPETLCCVFDPADPAAVSAKLHSA